MKVAMGYDSHRFVAGRRLMLAGVEIPSDKGLAGHSDADAVCHAVVDAILGALAAGDIGQRYPDTDPKWAGADSGRFVRETVALAEQAGLAVAHCDVTIVAEAPKLGAHREAMRGSLAGLLAAPIEAVSIKAKTNEGMGWVGRGEGLAVWAIVTLEKKQA